MTDFLARYREILNKPPNNGSILTSIDGSPVILTVQADKGKPPFIYGRAYVSEILDESLGWYLRGCDDNRQIGWKCVLMTRARRDVIESCDLDEDNQFLITSLKVVRVSKSGQSLLCEISEYLE